MNTTTNTNEQPSDRMLKWFAYAHLPAHLQEVSGPFAELARRIVDAIEPGPERTTAETDQSPDRPLPTLVPLPSPLPPLMGAAK